VIAQRVVLGVFVASGVAALIYQIIWQRLLTFVTGADAHSTTIIVASFMAGLGLGSLFGGEVADRVGRRARYWAFAGCEFAIAAFALGSVGWYYGFLYRELGTRELSTAATALLGFLATLWPTFFMGASLPLAARMLTDDPRQPAQWVATLYGWNTIGAAIGAGVTVAVLLPWLPAEGIVRVGAALNLACAVLAGVLALRLPAERPVMAATAVPAPRPEGARRFRFWLLAAASSSFVALSFELVWFRIAGVILKSNARTFGILLVLYLGGLGLGALAANSARARRWPAVRSFFVLQAAIPVFGVVAPSLLVAVVAVFPGAARQWWTVMRYEDDPIFSVTTMVALAAGALVPLWLISAPTFLMGLAFGSLHRAVQSDVRLLGRRVGWLQAAGIAGASSGALITGGVALDLFGTAGTLRLLALPAGVFLWLALRDMQRTPAVSAMAAAGSVVAMMLMVPPTPALWSPLHGSIGLGAIVREDGSGVALIRPHDDGGSVVYANGRSQSELPYRGIHTQLGAFPVLLHPHPTTVAAIGLGSGNTAFSLGARPETTRIESIEIVGPVLEALRALDRRGADPGLRALFDDPRVEHYQRDGRAHLSRATTRYDVIEADALRPQGAFAGFLYSVEYFGLLRDRLAPGGFAVSWVPTTRTLDSMRAVFPLVTVWGEIAIGSERPIVIDRAAIQARLAHPFTAARFRGAGIDLPEIINELLDEQPVIYTPPLDHSWPGGLNTDLFPRDEFGHR